MVDALSASPVSVEPTIPVGNPRALPGGQSRPDHALKHTRIALVHDWLCGYRGGEAVLERLARLVLDHAVPAGLWVMLDDRRPVAPAIDALPRHTSILQDIPFASGPLRRHLLPLYPRAISDISDQLERVHRAAPIDLVISTSSAAAKGVRPPAGVPHLCYCHTPPRYLWSQPEQYARAGFTTRLGLRLCGPVLRRWDSATAVHVTRFLANSHHTAREISRRYNRDSRVLFPPVRTDYFTPDPAAFREDFWLLAGALEPYKRTDLGIDAALLAGRPVVIAGTGTQLAHLRARYRNLPVRFLGRVPDDGLRDLYRRAALLVFPQVEDFGIVAVEAQACGLPVLARGAGGALDTVIEGQTGALFDFPTPHAMVDATARLPDSAALLCRHNSLRFSEDRFDREILDEIRGLVSEHNANETHPPLRG